MAQTTNQQTSQLALLKAAAYELKKPLSHIHGVSSLLSSGAITDHLELLDQYRYLAESSKRMQILIDSLLFLGQIENNQLSLSFDTINPASVANDVIRDLRPISNQYDRTIDLSVSSSLSPVNANHDAMHFAFYNLMDATIRSSRSEVIQLQLTRSHDQCVIKMIDQGESIDTKQFKQLEDNLGKRMQSLNSHGASSGISIYIAKSLAKTFNGQITCSNNSGRRNIKLCVPNSHQLTLV